MSSRRSCCPSAWTAERQLLALRRPRADDAPAHWRHRRAARAARVRHSSTSKLIGKEWAALGHQKRLREARRFGDGRTPEERLVAEQHFLMFGREDPERDPFMLNMREGAWTRPVEIQGVTGNGELASWRASERASGAAVTQDRRRLAPQLGGLLGRCVPSIRSPPRTCCRRRRCAAIVAPLPGRCRCTRPGRGRHERGACTVPLLPVDDAELVCRAAKGCLAAMMALRRACDGAGRQLTPNGYTAVQHLGPSRSARARRSAQAA